MAEAEPANEGPQCVVCAPASSFAGTSADAAGV
eukprot:SAG31_NODE_26086_length_448_cov_1.613181_1_plen_32_part_01